ncbi:MAG: YceI family protein [Deltaproteobacteria bacterium]|nr:YceI family protein [Deltaproteobacteria bacterium]
MRRPAGVLLILSTLLLTSGSSGAAPEWTFDPNHCEIVFKIRHIFAYVSGVFEKFDGKVLFDPNDLEGSFIHVRIEVNSIDTRIEKRDEHLRSEEFLDAQKFPYMTFTSSEIVHKKDNDYIARGKLKIKDVILQIELPFTYLGSRTDPFNDKQEVAGFDAEYELDRLIYHVGSGKYYEQGVIGKDVTISIHVELLRAR